MEDETDEDRDALCTAPMITEETRELVVHKSHRRTVATDWNELTSRIFDESTPQSKAQEHCRSFAMTRDEHMDLTSACDEPDEPCAQTPVRYEGVRNLGAWNAPETDENEL